MEQSPIHRLMSYLYTEPGIDSVDAFDSIESEIGVILPADYKAFLMLTNGAETRPPLTRFRFYPLSELLPRREEGQPLGTIEIATDDSDGYGLDLTRNKNNANYPIVRYPLGEVTRNMVEEVSDGFREFIERLLKQLSPIEPL